MAFFSVTFPGIIVFPLQELNQLAFGTADAKSTHNKEEKK